MNSAELGIAVINTLLVIGICNLIALPIGSLLAFFLFRTDIYGRWAGWLTMGSQIALPLYVFAGGWSACIGTQGWLTAWADLSLPLGVSANESSWLPLLVVSLIHAVAMVPWVGLIVSLGLQFRDRGLEEQSLLDGGWWFVWRHVLMPGLKPWFLLAAIWCSVPILTEMVVTNLYQVPTVAEQVYLDASRGTAAGMTYLASMGLVGLTTVMVGLAILFLGRTATRASRRQPLFTADALPLGAWRVPASILTWAVLFVLVGVPILSLFAKAGWQPFVDADGLTRYGWRFSRLLTTIEESATEFGHEYFWSAILACTASMTALATAGLLAWVTKSRGRFIVHLAMLCLIAVPGPTVGMMVTYLMNRAEPEWMGKLYDTTLAAPVLAQQFRLLPLAWALMLTIVSSISQPTWEQIKIDRLGVWSAFLRIVLPQTWARFLTAALLLAVLSVGELSCSILVLPPGVTTLSMRLFEMLHFGMRHQDSGICGVLVVLGWIACWSLGKTLRDR